LRYNRESKFSPYFTCSFNVLWDIFPKKINPFFRIEKGFFPFIPFSSEKKGILKRIGSKMKYLIIEKDKQMTK